MRPLTTPVIFLTPLVLHLGNVYFHRKQLKHGQEAVEIGSKKEIKWAAHLLQIDSEGIIRALTTKSTVSILGPATSIILSHRIQIIKNDDCCVFRH